MQSKENIYNLIIFLTNLEVTNWVKIFILVIRAKLQSSAKKYRMPQINFTFILNSFKIKQYFSYKDKVLLC